jgi:hypothetical protein
MNTRIKCYTLFDITNTGILSRKTPVNLLPEKVLDWETDRARQSNFDTIIQVISLRTQPEDITKPVKDIVEFKDNDKFGFLFEQEEPQNFWTFEFSIHYENAYADGVNELGALYEDCESVPMLHISSQWNKLPHFLDTSPELRNIYFEVLTDE